ncbi:MAG: HAMP domain-containing histidine kinase [Paenibacillaceae bacterium]|nr:HAMP domain-containing histidine kinase [Paenibacillaceae bacterium]
MGSRKLAVKLWGAFVALTLLIFALLAVLLPWTLKGFFTEQLYDILLNTQNSISVEMASTLSLSAKPLTSVDVQPTSYASGSNATGTVAVGPGAVGSFATTGAGTTKPNANGTVASGSLPNIPLLTEPSATLQWAESLQTSAVVEPVYTLSTQSLPVGIPIAPLSEARPSVGLFAGSSINHFTISGTSAQPAVQGQEGGGALPAAFLQTIEHNAFAQVVPLAKYSLSVDSDSIFYVIRRDMVEGAAQPQYVVSYVSGNYRNDLVMSMFSRLLWLMLALIVVSLPLCLLLARYLTRPLVQIERHVGRVAERDWHEPLVTGRKDEIGRLAGAIESMRQRLVHQDESQQFFLQNISHELKTPVMVIRSYAQSIQDGIFPRGSLNDSLNVIMKEGERLEKRIRELLLLNKLRFFASRGKLRQTFDLSEVAEDVVERLRYRRPDVAWTLELAPGAMLTGDREQWAVALENVLDNQLRYARSAIGVTVAPGGDETGPALPRVCVRNDGPPLDEAATESLFEPFRTGSDGQFGLGLAIVKQIAAHHGMAVRAVNEAGGVAFFIEPEG